MGRRCGRPPRVESHVVAHLRATVWGPAEFAGFPPRGLVAQGIFVAVLGLTAILGTTLAGASTGVPALADGEAGLACAVALTLCLLLARAGRALVGTVAVLGVCLALRAPQAAAGVVLAERGREEPVVVTSVRDSGATGAAGGRYVCSVVDFDGVPLKTPIWRGCGEKTRPGDALAVVYDPRGRVPPRGVGPGGGVFGAVRGLVPWAAVFSAVCVVTVVRSYRLSAPAPARDGHQAAAGEGH
ncbi:hypothetical protein [Streptomyces sp. NK08204]|uniref:hypothetical protein n=1 Tax=Streptomyces sp. NK08204 TaxID=2873260 RepID=UPI001CED5C65|nr:hypothetical protein [Streptomyces sp. NK08204]